MSSVTIVTATELTVLTTMLVLLLRKRAAQLRLVTTQL